MLKVTIIKLLTKCKGIETSINTQNIKLHTSTNLERASMHRTRKIHITYNGHNLELRNLIQLEDYQRTTIYTIKNFNLKKSQKGADC